MGIIKFQEMADRMVVKWILRGLLNWSEICAKLMFRKSDKLGLKGKEKWLNLPKITIWARKGPQVVSSLWKSWFRLKVNLVSTVFIKNSMGNHGWD